MQRVLFPFVISLLVSSNQSRATEPILCDISRRTESCPQGYCCARDEFLPEYVVCKKHGRIHSSCATVDVVSVCPCQHGLKCIPNVNSASFVSIYGKCLPSVPTTITTTVKTTTTTTTAPTTTTIFLKTTIKHNTPPLIRLHEMVAKIYRFSDIGQKVTSFTVVDNDSGKNGEVQCSVMLIPYFSINKIDGKAFDVVLAASLSTLSPQIIPTFIICEDSGSPKSNGVAQMEIQIVDKNPVHTSSSTTATPSTSLILPLKSSIETVTTPSKMLSTANTIAFKTLLTSSRSTALRPTK